MFRPGQTGGQCGGFRSGDGGIRPEGERTVHPCEDPLGVKPQNGPGGGIRGGDIFYGGSNQNGVVALRQTLGKARGGKDLSQFPAGDGPGIAVELPGADDPAGLAVIHRCAVPELARMDRGVEVVSQKAAVHVGGNLNSLSHGDRPARLKRSAPGPDMIPVL